MYYFGDLLQQLCPSPASVKVEPGDQPLIKAPKRELSIFDDDVVITVIDCDSGSNGTGWSAEVQLPFHTTHGTGSSTVVETASTGVTWTDQTGSELLSY